MKKIIINENKIPILVKSFLAEETVYLGDKKEMVVKWLQSHFQPIDVQKQNSLALPSKTRALIVLDANGQVTEQIKSIEDVFYILQTNFKKILSDRKERDRFLWETGKTLKEGENPDGKKNGGEK